MNKVEHEVSDPVYSNSYGFGYIYKIEEAQVSYFSSEQTTFYYVRWFNEDVTMSFYPEGEKRYEAKGVDTLKMFLSIKMRGENV